MDNRFYTIDQIAELLGMHHKTIRKFIREGKLGAVKVGKQWRISGHDLSIFMEQHNVRVNEAKGKESNIEYTTSETNLKDIDQRVNVSAVIDIGEVDSNEYMRISNTLIALANCRSIEAGKSTIQVEYDEGDKRIRVILWGSIRFIEDMLSSVAMLIEAKAL